MKTKSPPLSETGRYGILILTIIGIVFITSCKEEYQQDDQIVDDCEIPEAEKIDENPTISFEPKMELDVKGIIFMDVFEWIGAPEFSFPPDDPECRARRLERAMEAPARIGANWIGITPSAFINEVDPLEIGDWNNDLSLTDDTHYAELINSAEERGFKIMHVEQISPSPDLSEEQLINLESLKNSDRRWWEDFFKQWKDRLVSRAARAEQYSVDMFVLLSAAEDTFRSDVYPLYDEKWKAIIN